MTSVACKSVIACAKSTILTRTSGEYFIPLSSSRESISSCVAPSYKNSNDVAYNRYCGIVLMIASATQIRINVARGCASEEAEVEVSEGGKRSGTYQVV